MAPGDEMLEFTRSFFRTCPDLSTVTHSIVRQKFLIHVGRDHLEPEEKQALKRLVEEELLKMQADAGTREGKPDFIKVKRSPAPCSDPERKRFRFNSESESSSIPSSPDCSGPPTKNSTTKKACPRRALKKAVESTDEDQQTDLGAKMGLEESSEEEAKGPVRSGEVWKAEDTEKDDDRRKEQKGGARKKAGARNKQAPHKADRKQAREESGSSEEEAVQSRAKVEGSTGAKAQEESDDSGEEVLARKSGHREPRSRGNKAGRTASERKSYKQKSRAGRPTGGLGDSEAEKEGGAVSSGDSNGEEEDHSVKRKSKARAQTESGRRQSTSSEEDGNSTQVQAATQDTTKTGSLGSSNGDSGTERELSDSQAGQNTREERKSRSSKKSAKNSKARSSSSSSSDASPEPTGQKAGSRRCGEDHPAVARLKRYIRACGAHRNYKKLLGSCGSHKERLSVLRAELEALGMKGNPSLEKCRALKQQREEAAEVASLDVANIISSTGRPRRRNAWNPSGEGISPGELYHRTLDSEEERPRQAPPDWSHMRGIISSDGDSS
ncbi:HIRA-interacting protein 3 [Arvicanthis niloticus]|uniref:HIRA-interacting protein 3 n=1 Tax=Arvicanthis niloticus TaxID=61156 RepID=UPI0014874E01|nr:HIRA-interacting protein 3 [Arvicanthis niloticus]